MIRIDVLIREDQRTALINLPGSKSEHIRRALDDYFHQQQMKDVRATISPSKNKALNCGGCAAQPGWPHAAGCEAVKIH